MSDQSAIEWTDATWNPVRGCTKVSAGCKHCYAETFAERWRAVPGHPFVQGFDLRLVPEALALPLHWKTPRRIFVNSMSDLFHEGVPDEFIAVVFGIMSVCPQHTFQVLTKRAARARNWFAWMETYYSPAHRMWRAICEGPSVGGYPEAWEGEDGPPVSDAWPLPNVWLGVSVEDQAAADERIPELLATPAAVRFLSSEPLLGPVKLPPEALGGYPESEEWARSGPYRPRIDWVIAGGESGPKARACDVAWVRSLVEQCRAAEVPVFVKQLGARAVMAEEAWHAAARSGPAPIIRPGAEGGFVRLALDRSKGGDVRWWPRDLRIREMPRRNTP